MEYSLLFWLTVTAVTAVNHHHPHPPDQHHYPYVTRVTHEPTYEPANASLQLNYRADHIECYTHHCDDHHPVCHIKVDHEGNIHGNCADDKHCGLTCGSPYDDHDGCCCHTKTCVDAVRAAPTHAPPQPITCPNCHDIRHCNLVSEVCHHDDICMFKQHPEGEIESRCIKEHECEHFRAEGMKHHHEPTTCCHDTACTQTALQHYTTGTANSLHCTTCTDILTNVCSGDHTCNAYEVCMFRHNGLRVESGCTKIPECSLHHVQGMTDPAMLTICCDTLNCTQHATYQAKNVNILPATTPQTCGDQEDANFHCADYVRLYDICNKVSGTGLILATNRCQKTCGLCPATTPQTCGDQEDANFHCADYVRLYDICNKVSGTGLILATTRCQKTCGLCPGSATGTAAQTTTAAPITAAQSTAAQSTAASMTTQGATMAPMKTTTQATTTGTHPPCVDHDVKNSCAAYAFYFCAATSGQAKQFAVTNCAKTCNLCNEYYASLNGGTATQAPAPIVVG